MIRMWFSCPHKEVQLRDHKNKWPISNSANSFKQGCYWLHDYNVIRFDMKTQNKINKEKKQQRSIFQIFIQTHQQKQGYSSVCFLDWIKKRGLRLWLQCFKEAKCFSVRSLVMVVQMFLYHFPDGSGTNNNTSTYRSSVSLNKIKLRYI